MVHGAVLYDQVVEVKERLIMDKDGPVTGVTGEKLSVETPIDIEALRKSLTAVYSTGIRSLAVVLLHSYLCDDHEREVGRIAREVGFTHVSLSSAVMRMAKIVPRGFTTCADAYLTPCLKRYVRSFSDGFNNDLKGVNVSFMQSDGGLTPVENFIGSRAILSG